MMKVMTFHGLQPSEWVEWAADNGVFHSISSTKRIAVQKPVGVWNEYPVLTIVLIDPDREVEIRLRWPDYIQEPTTD